MLCLSLPLVCGNNILQLITTLYCSVATSTCWAVLIASRWCYFVTNNYPKNLLLTKSQLISALPLRHHRHSAMPAIFSSLFDFSIFDSISKSDSQQCHNDHEAFRQQRFVLLRSCCSGWLASCSILLHVPAWSVCIWPQWIGCMMNETRWKPLCHWLPLLP